MCGIAGFIDTEHRFNDPAKLELWFQVYIDEPAIHVEQGLQVQTSQLAL